MRPSLSGLKAAEVMASQNQEALMGPNGPHHTGSADGRTDSYMREREREN